MELLNASLQEAVIPPVWKHAMILPLLKKANADPSQPANFRPISLIPTFSKILEKHVNLQLSQYVESNGLLHPSKSGFRNGFSTETKLLGVTEMLRSRLDAGETVALILLDLSAAFDTVSYTLLLQVLRSSVVVGPALQWLANFLEDRTYQVFSSAAMSKIHKSLYGVPQGSILSPLLFNIYVKTPG